MIKRLHCISIFFLMIGSNCINNSNDPFNLHVKTFPPQGNWIVCAMKDSADSSVWETITIDCVVLNPDNEKNARNFYIFNDSLFAYKCLGVWTEKWQMFPQEGSHLLQLKQPSIGSYYAYELWTWYLSIDTLNMKNLSTKIDYKYIKSNDSMNVY